MLVEVELDDRALGHRVDLDGFRVFSSVLVLLLEDYRFCGSGRQRGEEGAGGVREGENGDGATHCCWAVVFAVIMVVRFLCTKVLRLVLRCYDKVRRALRRAKGVARGQ